MLVDIEIAAGLEFQIEASMMSEEFQHVVKEPDASGHLIAPAPLNGE
jgi:hypothetical protein